MKQVRVAVDNEGNKEIDYDILEFDDKTEFIYSKDGNWGDNIKGKIAGTHVDNGWEINIKIDNKKIKLDYWEAELLLAMLMNANDHSIEIVEQKVIKSVT